MQWIAVFIYIYMWVCIILYLCVYGYFVFCMLSLPPHVGCHLLVYPSTSRYFPAPPASIPYYTIRSSAQLTVNSNAIIYTTHLHCTADRLTKKNLPTDCAAQLFECGRINKAAYFVATLGVEIYCWISAHLLQINNHKFGTQSLPKWSMHFATHSLAFTFALDLIFNLLLLLKLI